MSISIIFAGVIVSVLPDGGVGRQLLQPLFLILVKAVLVVVDEYAGRNVLRIYKGQYPLCHITLMPLPVEALAAIGRALRNYN
jgi:hypothetical protein